MPVTIGYLYEKSINLYHMQLLAGSKGLECPVEWVHMIESSRAALFLHGGEVVFLTGVLYKSDDWLLEFIRRLKGRQCAGLVINTGPYIKQIPKSVLDYCNEYNFPLFSLPWKVHLVDITRYWCRFIINDEKQRQSIIDFLQQALISPKECQSACLALENQGFSVEGNFWIVVVQSDDLTCNHGEITALIKLWNDKYMLFSYHENSIVVLSEKSFENIRIIVESMYDFLKDKQIKVSISVGSAVKHVSKLSLSYQQALAINSLSKNYQPPVVYYDYMGLYKLLLNGTPLQVLKNFYMDVLGSLDSYDKTHNSNLMETLRYYIEHDCNIKETAMHEVVHRNTVLYKFHKIEEILGMSIHSEENKLSILMAFKIKNIF